MQSTFEEKFSEFVGIPCRAVSNAGSGLLAILDYIDVRSKDVVVPANTFWATPQAGAETCLLRSRRGYKKPQRECNDCRFTAE